MSKLGKDNHMFTFGVRFEFSNFDEAMKAAIDVKRYNCRVSPITRKDKGYCYRGQDRIKFIVSKMDVDKVYTRGQLYTISRQQFQTHYKTFQRDITLMIMNDVITVEKKVGGTGGSTKYIKLKDGTRANFIIDEKE